jgi:putative transposase
VAGGRRRSEQGAFWGDFVGKNPTDRGKSGTKRLLLVEESGGPLGAIVAPANDHDSTLIQGVIESVVTNRPDPDKVEQHLCLDKGFDTPSARAAVDAAGYVPHIRSIGEDAKPCDRSKGHMPRRWVVERTIAWLNRCRAILVRYDKKAENYLGLTQLACALLWWRRVCKLGDQLVSG